MHGRPVLAVLGAKPTGKLPVALEDDEHDDTVWGKLIDDAVAPNDHLADIVAT